MTDMMKAYRIIEWEQPPVLTEAPGPEPGPGQVVVKVAGNGLCHSDVGMAQIPGVFAEMLGWSAPFTLGHEVGGHIAALGAGVTGWAEGDAVAVVSPRSCGSCVWCVRGQDSLCDDSAVGRGYGMDGGLARFVLVSSTRELIRLHGLDPLYAAPLTDAGATSMHAVKRALPRIRPGGHVVVLGAGGLGAYAIQFLRELTSASIIAVDQAAGRLAYASELGAATTIEGVTADTAGDILALTGGGADAVFDFVGIDDTIAQGLRSTARGGAYALIGAAGGRLRGADWMSALPKDGEIFTFQASNIADAHDVFALADAGRLQIDIDVFTLDRVKDAYETMEAGALRGRAVVTPD